MLPTSHTRRWALVLLGWLVLGFSLLPKALAAAQPRTVSGGVSLPFSRTLWRVGDGLPEATVQALQLGSGESLWVGTTGGLVDFDGTALRPAPVDTSGATGPVSVFSLLRANDGTIWAGTEGSGVLHLDGQSRRWLSVPTGLSGTFVRALCQDASGTLWVGTDTGLFRLRQGRFERFGDDPALPPLAVHALALGSDGSLLVGGSRFFSVTADGRTHPFTLPGAYSENRVKTILETHDHVVWVGTVSGLAMSAGNRFLQIKGIHATVRSLLESKDGTLWIGTIGNGLWLLSRGHLNRANSAGLLPSETILSMSQDEHGQIWIGTQGGLVRLEHSEVDILPLPGASDADYETLSSDRNGALWASARGLFTIRNDRPMRANLGLPPESGMRTVYRDRENTLWVGTDGSGLYGLGNGRVVHLTAPEQLTNNFIRALLETRNGDLWIATDEGVNRLSRGNILRLNMSSGLSYFSTRCLLESADGSLWIGTDRGVSRWSENGFQQDNITRALQKEKIWSMMQDRTGALWFATRDHGLYREQNGKLTQYTVADGLPTNSIYNLMQDHGGTFWMTGPTVIASLPELEMDGGSPDRGHPLSVRTYALPFSADDAQMYGGQQPEGVIAKDGDIYFPTSRGVAKISPRAASIAGAEPRAFISGVQVDGKSLSPDAGLRLGGNASRVSFAYAAVGLQPSKSVRFKYRLAPFETTWVTSQHSGLATYTNLPAGAYEFQLQTFEEDSPQSVSEAVLSMRKAALFYKSRWFYTACALIVLSLGWCIYWLRMRQLRTRFDAVLSERMRLARELHDTVIQGCTGISALLEAVASGGGPMGATDLFEFARQQARNTIDEARQAVYGMRHSSEKPTDLMSPLRDVAVQMSREFSTPVSIHAEQTSLQVMESNVHEVIMIIREAVYNAIQHSGSASIDIHATTKARELTLIVADHGNGFELSSTPGLNDGHYGITGMRERANRIGGRLELSSRIGVGTTVRLALRNRPGSLRKRSARRQGDDDRHAH